MAESATIRTGAKIMLKSAGNVSSFCPLEGAIAVLWKGGKGWKAEELGFAWVNYRDHVTTFTNVVIGVNIS